MCRLWGGLLAKRKTLCSTQRPNYNWHFFQLHLQLNGLMIIATRLFNNTSGKHSHTEIFKMAFTVVINKQAFSVHDRFKQIIASVAVGEQLSLHAENVSKNIIVTKFTSILNDDYTVQDYLFEGTDTNSDSDADSQLTTKDIGDQARLWGLIPNPHKVSDELAFYFSHLQQKSIIKYKGVEYYLNKRHTNIITYQAPLGGGLFSQLYFKKV